MLAVFESCALYFLVGDIFQQISNMFMNKIKDINPICSGAELWRGGCNMLSTQKVALEGIDLIYTDF